MAPPFGALDNLTDFIENSEICKTSISRLIKQIVQLYDVILEFFRVNAENEVRVALSELPQKYDALDEKRAYGSNDHMSDLIREAQDILELAPLGVVRAEMKIWKKLWKVWGKDATFIPWRQPYFLASVDPDTWGETKDYNRVMKNIETDDRCLRCKTPYSGEEVTCGTCGAFNIPTLKCLVLIDALIGKLAIMYIFITRNNIKISEDTYRNRCIDRSHPFHGIRGQCTLGTWPIPPRIRKYLESYPHGFAPLDAISDTRLRKYIINDFLDYKFFRFDLAQIIQTPEIMGDDFAGLLAIPEPASRAFRDLRATIMDGNIEWLGQIIDILLDLHDYPGRNSYRDIEGDMKLEMKYLDIFDPRFGLDPENQPTTMLPLTLAVKAPASEHKREIISFLIREGADLNASDARNHGRTPLMEAVVLDDLETIELIRATLRGERRQDAIDWDAQDNTGATVFELGGIEYHGNIFQNDDIQAYLKEWRDAH